LIKLGFGESRLSALGIAWWITLIVLLLAWFTPLFTVRRFWIFNNTVTMLGGLGQLFAAGEYLLFVLIGSFSVLFPLAKMLALFPRCHGIDLRPAAGIWVRRLNAMGHWSMLDVFVVAILVVVIKLGDVVRIEIRYGLYLFAAAVIFSMLLAKTQRIEQHE